MLDSTQRTTAAELLWAAERDLAPIGPLTETFPGIDVVDAYEIQLEQHPAEARRRRPGAGPQGRPVLPGHAADDGRRRARLRAPARLDGAAPRTRRSRPPGTATRGSRSRSATCSGRALPGAGCTEADVLAATEYIVPSLELIDSRITDWRIKLADTIADNASSAG